MDRPLRYSPRCAHGFVGPHMVLDPAGDWQPYDPAPYAEIERLQTALDEAHAIIRADIATQEAVKMRNALVLIRREEIPQGMSPSLFAGKVLDASGADRRQ